MVPKKVEQINDPLLPRVKSVIEQSNDAFDDLITASVVSSVVKTNKL